MIWGLEGEELPPQGVFPLEPVAVFIGGEKMTSDTGECLRFWAHRKLAKELYLKHKILTPVQYEEVAWKSVYDTLHEVPRMFQIWACKQVMSIAGTNLNQSKYKDNHDPSCPSCTVCEESCEHILMYNEEGRVEALMVSIALMDKWMRNARTDNALR